MDIKLSWDSSVTSASNSAAIEAAIQQAGGLGYAVGWLGNALAVINTAKSSSYAAYSAAASSFDTQIANAHAYSLQLANSNPENIATVSVGMTGVLTQPFDQAT